jgi:hypothetical protein
MKVIRLTSLAALLLLGLSAHGWAEPCSKTCNQCCPASAPCCPKANCNKVCSECCKSEDSCCSEKKSKCSSTDSVPLERGGKKISPYGDKGCPRRY